jgi:ATP-dependent DNA helicase DinG
MSLPTKPKKAARTTKKRASQRPEVASLEDFFGPEGPLAEVLPDYEKRDEQVQIALAIEEAMQAGKPCLAEAGTGVGKTLAYLIPAIRAALDGKRTVISTHTISLQSQLMEKDIPLVLRLFPEAEARVSATLMKGRGNFLCQQSLDNARGDLFLMADPYFRRLQKWARDPLCTGDVADLPFSFSAWSEVTSTPETCRAQQCPHYNNCHYYRRRWEAAESNIIVVNHALFFADLALRLSDPQSGILPEYHNVVFDEAHHLEDVATKTFGIEFGSRRLLNLMDRVKHVRGFDVDKSRLQTVEEMNATLFAPFFQSGKTEFFFEDALTEEGQNQAKEWASNTSTALSTLQNDILATAKDDENLKDQLEGMARLCGRAREELDRLFSKKDEKDENAIRWGQVSVSGSRSKPEPRATLYLTPVSVAKVLQNALWSRMQASRGSVVLVSATLATSGTFAYQRARLGIPDDAIECIVGSPFEFKTQALLYVPAHLPAPAPLSVPAYLAQVVAEIERLLKLTGGRAFLLFTSRAMLNAVYEQLDGKLPFPLFKQGDLPPGKLIEAFKESGNGCLFGVQTFWEGVDVQGEALSCVVIDRLPFAVPDSPITKARVKAIEDGGGNSFRDYSIPQAQIRLKQGFGRLIRTHADRGIVCILDTRLLHKEYGADFVRSLPPAARASKWTRVERFWHGEEKPSESAGETPGADPTLAS